MTGDRRSGSAAERKDSAEAAPGTPTVLVVDDDSRVRRMACKLLESAGYVVHHAASGHDALALVSESPFSIDVAVVDWMMEGLDGEETVQALRRVCPGVRIVLTSGYGLEELSDILDRLGAPDLVEKPFTRQDLLDAVKRALEAT